MQASLNKHLFAPQITFMYDEAWRCMAQESTQEMRSYHRVPPHVLVGNRLVKEAWSYQETEPMMMWRKSSPQIQ